MIGKTLAHYEIRELLGEGGMGRVYRALDATLGREVAVKLLPAGLTGDAQRLARFEREARTVASLNHPNIVTLFSVEDADGTRFLTMELVEGEGLDQCVVAGGLPIERVVELGAAIADALCAAHEKGVVHRDLKPANVMLTREGRVKVLDFGLAKLGESASGDAGEEAADPMDAATLASPLSEAGQMMGTLPYMAPEQVRGEEVDPRTDIFALGILLYELATGRRPFEGKTPGVLSSAILRDAPSSVSNLRQDAPAALEHIITRCLEKDPEARYQSAIDLRVELRRVSEGGPGVTARPRDLGRILVAPPAPATPLLGREEHLTQAVQRLEEGARLLTISGYGGTGKTRFSIALFDRLAPKFTAGAAFVSLASVIDAREVMPTVATALDIAEAHDRSALEALCAVIAERRMLLVLDNLEQVLDAAQDIAQLVARCPQLQVLATSRAPLKVSAESEFALPPLELPGQEEHSLDQLRRCPSVALFVQRAVKVKAGFELSADNAEAVASICRRLDGLPLALELAAARVRILDPAKLLQRLDHALDLLTSGDRDLPMRQKTLRATISWSYSLLEAPEQQLLRRGSVFHEGWTFEAMEQVCYDDEDRWRALDELESLVEKGLVRVIGNGERYALLETIRAFAAEQLHAGGEVDRIRDAHADWFVGWTGEMARQFRLPGQHDAVRAIRADNANELAAIHWVTAAARNGDAAALEKGLLLCGHLDWFWHMWGLHLTARGLVDGLLTLAKDRGPSRGRGLAYLCAGMVSITTGEIQRSLDDWTAGYEDGLALGDEGIAAEGCMGMGYVHLSDGRLREALPYLDEGMERGSAAGDEFIQALSMAVKGLAVFQLGDQVAGMRMTRDAHAIQERLGDGEGGGIALSFLAQMHFSRGDRRKALELYESSLEAFHSATDRPEIARVHCEMGWTALADDDVSGARRSFRNALQMYEEVGSARGSGLALLGLAAVEAAEGHTERAVTIAEAAKALAARAGVVCDHPMDPGVAQRIAELKASIPQGEVEGLVAGADDLTPAAILAMIVE